MIPCAAPSPLFPGTISKSGPKPAPKWAPVGLRHGVSSQAHQPVFGLPARQIVPAATAVGQMLPARGMHTQLKFQEKIAAAARHGSC
jgi:hypothetical protein